MPKCPKCKKGIDHLVMIENRNYFFDFTAEGIREDSVTWSMVGRAWLCPECDEGLFSSVEGAKEFLGKEVKNGDKG